MQTPKSKIRKRVIKAAYNEFREKGFQNASMRNISKNAKVSLSNIYNYFDNKDELFIKTLKPLLKKLENFMQDHNNPENISLNLFESEEFQKKSLERYLNLIIHYKEPLNILLFNSSGSSLESFRDEYTNRHTKTGMEYIKKMAEKYPFIKSDYSEFFMHTISSWWFSIIGEIVSHNLSEDEIIRFIKEYMEFSTAGWKKIMNA